MMNQIDETNNRKKMEVKNKARSHAICTKRINKGNVEEYENLIVRKVGDMARRRLKRTGQWDESGDFESTSVKGM
jgi:hypothetical protein